MTHDVDYALRCLKWLANAVAVDYKVNNMSTQLKQKTDKFYDAIRHVIDWHNLTYKELLKLGFMNCGYEDTDPYELWLIPQWLYPIIPEGLLVEDLDRNEFEFHRHTAPYDLFYGCMKYGIKLKNESYGKTLEELIKEMPDDN